MMDKYYAARLAGIQKRLATENIDALFIDNMTNVRYLTGFTGSAGSLIVQKDHAILVSDSRYETQIASECAGGISSGDLDVAICPADVARPTFAMQQVGSTGAKTVGYEQTTISKTAFDGLAESLKAELVQTTSWVEQARSIKDDGEIAAIRKSIDVNERAFKKTLSELRGDQTERDFAHKLEHTMRGMGATGCAFAPIVGVGPRAALPHGTPSESVIGGSPFFLVDWGASVDGYCSDLTRIVVTGKIPPKLREIYEIVLSAHAAAIASIRPGIEVRQLDRAARSVIESSGFAEYFGHGLGHGFGLEIHEVPFMSPTRDGTIQAGMVITVEPGIYLPGEVGVRIEDDILVTADGYEILSKLPRQLDECIVSTVA